MERSKYCFFLSLPLLLGVLTPTDAQNYRRDENNGAYFANFEKNPSVRLNAYVLATLMTSNHGQCTFECINNKHCYSVNYAASLDGGKPSCQLLNTDKFVNAHDLSSLLHGIISLAERTLPVVSFKTTSGVMSGIFPAFDDASSSETKRTIFDTSS